MGWGELLWDREELSDEALVVRGGKELTDRTLWKNANSVVLETAEADPNGRGYWGVCVGAADGLNPNEIALRMPYRGDWMFFARLGNLRGQGFDVVPVWDDDDESTHAVLLLNDEPPEAWEGWIIWELLRAPFDGPAEIIRV